MDEISERVRLYEDGIYRWVYELDLKNSDTVAVLMIKIMAVCILLPFVLMMGVFIINGHLRGFFEDVVPIYLLVGAIVGLISVACYYGVAWYYGWSFTYLYEMDDEKITMYYYDKDVKKAEVIGRLTAYVGALTGNMGLVGSGLYMAGTNGFESYFTKAYRVKAKPEKEYISISSFMLYNMIFVNRWDYDFVLDYIRERTRKQ